MGEMAAQSRREESVRCQRRAVAAGPDRKGAVALLLGTESAEAL
jgi:hypothetical protein